MSAPKILSKHHAITVVILGIVLTFSLRPWRERSPVEPTIDQAFHEEAVADESSGVPPSIIEPNRTKSRIRPTHSKQTVEETIELIRTTIIPLIDLPTDQALPERIARINELIQKAGVEPTRLRLVLRSADPANQWRFKNELRIREVPLDVALKYVVDTTKLRYQVRENGIIELTTLTDQEPLPNLPDSQKTAVPPQADKTDAFGNVFDAPEKLDPFANPPAR